MAQLPTVHQTDQADTGRQGQLVLPERILGRRATDQIGGERVGPVYRQFPHLSPTGPTQHGPDAFQHVDDLPARIQLGCTTGPTVARRRVLMQEGPEFDGESAVDVSRQGPAPAAVGLFGEVEDGLQPGAVIPGRPYSLELTLLGQEGVGQLAEGEAWHRLVCEGSLALFTGPNERAVLDLGQQAAQAGRRLGLVGAEGGPEHPPPEAAAGQELAVAPVNVDVDAAGGPVGVGSHQVPTHHGPPLVEGGRGFRVERGGSGHGLVQVGCHRGWVGHPANPG